MSQCDNDHLHLAEPTMKTMLSSLRGECKAMIEDLATKYPIRVQAYRNRLQCIEGWMREAGMKVD